MNHGKTSFGRSNLILGLVAAALAVPTWLQVQRDGGVFTDIGQIPLMFDGFTSDNVGSVLLARPKAEQPPDQPAQPGADPNKRAIAYDQLVLQRTPETARGARGFQIMPTNQAGAAQDLAGAPVAQERVEAEVWSHLRRIRSDRETLVQANASDEQLERYGLDEAHAFVIRVTDQNNTAVIAELLVGRDASAGQTGTEAIAGVYVRKGGSNDVVLYEFDQTVKFWRPDVEPGNWIDKLLFRLEPTQVEYLSLRNPSGGAAAFVWKKVDGKASWIADPQPVDAQGEPLGAVRQTEIETIVQRLRYVAAQEFQRPMARAGNLSALGLGPPVIELEARWREGDQLRTVRLEIGNKLEGRNEYYLASSESQFLMTWPASLVVPLEADPRQFFDPAPPK